MSEKGGDRYVCDCGESFEGQRAIAGHARWCGEYTKARIERICSVCGGPFLVRPSAPDHGKGKYCSTECLREAQRDRVERECEECGETFETYPYVVDNGYGKFCSMACKYQGARVDDDTSRRGAYWERQREKALSRDGWECQECGMSQTKCRETYKFGLHVHHVRPERKFDSGEDPHALGNLKTLCPSCHPKRERE